jgi:hypothetical protein
MVTHLVWIFGLGEPCELNLMLLTEFFPMKSQPFRLFCSIVVVLVNGQNHSGEQGSLLSS